MEQLELPLNNQPQKEAKQPFQLTAKVGIEGHKMGLRITTPDGRVVDPATGLPATNPTEIQE